MGEILHLFPVLFLIFPIINHHNCEVFTAITDLEDLLHTEEIFIDTLDIYIKSEEQKLRSLKQYLEIYQKQYNEALEDTQTFITNPINAYVLIKRLTIDLQQIETLISTDLMGDYLTNLTQIKNTMKLPNDKDLNGAAVALARLQETYRLDTSSLARGELNGIKYSSELSVDDCFELGRQLYNNEDYYYSILWMKEAEQRLKNEENNTTHSDILEYLALSTYKLGNTSLALDLINKLLEILPRHQQALAYRVCYENELSKKIHQVEPDDDFTTVLKTYQQLCRGEISLSIEGQSKLKCRYLHRNNPFLRIAPFKIEEAYHKPDIWIFHDVLSDDEIDIIKKLSKPQLKRAQVLDPSGKDKITDDRVSKTAFLQAEEHEILAKSDQRVIDMTGLTLETAEKLQVVNYGIGGHYEPHFDFTTMNDVAQGGATVFPEIRVSLKPKKGTAAFWYNLHSSGDGDALTIHGACPVLLGSKWAANQWLHERGQEFSRPCTLERPDGRFVV